MVNMTTDDAERAQQITGCRVDDTVAMFPFCMVHDEDGNPPWDRCRWARAYRVLRAVRRQALLDAADWLDLDEDQGGPSYYIDTPAGRVAYYDAHPWAAEHLRKRAESL